MTLCKWCDEPMTGDPLACAHCDTPCERPQGQCGRCALGNQRVTRWRREGGHP